MFRRPLPPGAQAFTAWAFLGALIVYGHASPVASIAVIYAGGAFVLAGLIRDTSQWADVFGSGAGAGVLLVGLGAINVGYDGCVPPVSEVPICAGFPPEPHLVLGALLLAFSFGLWMLLRQSPMREQQA